MYIILSIVESERRLMFVYTPVQIYDSSDKGFVITKLIMHDSINYLV